MEYQLIRSRRKTLEIAVQPGGLVVVRAPLRLSREKIEDFLLRKQDWISAKQKQLAEKPPVPQYTPEVIASMKARTLALVTPRVESFSKKIGVAPTGIHITSARKPWGSCSGKNSLNFSFLLADKPPAFIDSVVIHELCHILHHDHSPAFWALVRQYDPHFPGKRPG